MYRKDVQEMISGTTEFLQDVIIEEVRKSGGKVEFTDACYPAADEYGDPKMNMFVSAFEKDNTVFVKYRDWAGEYEDPISLFTIDELVEIYSNL